MEALPKVPIRIRSTNVPVYSTVLSVVLKDIVPKTNVERSEVWREYMMVKALSVVALGTKRKLVLLSDIYSRTFCSEVH